MMRHSGALALVFLAWLSAAGGAMAATPAGKAVGVNPAASDVGNTTRTLVVGSDVAMGDRIVTGPSGQVQVIFNDDTHLVVGPSSSLVVESYLLRGGGGASKFTVDALGGTYRFITGRSDHSAYTIKTPTGTIGVRGTAFDFVVNKTTPVVPWHRPGTAVALFVGAVELCDLHGQCVVLTRQCELGGTSVAEAYSVSEEQAALAGARGKFRYILSERPLLPPFRVAQSRVCFLPPSAPPGTLATQVENGSKIVEDDYR